jgi:hypothetical protein
MHSSMGEGSSYSTNQTFFCKMRAKFLFAPARDVIEMSLLTLLPPDLLRVLLSFLTLQDIFIFDSALLNHELRSLYLSATHGHQIAYANKYSMRRGLHWVLNRGMLAHDLLITKEFEWFREFASKSMNTLRTLSIYSSDISDSELERMICPNLVSLTCSGCPEITSQGFQTFFSHCRNLRSLCLSETSSPSSAVIAIIIAHCPNLRQIRVSDDEWWTDASLDLLARSSLRLESLDLRHSLVSLEPISLLIKKMPSLLELKTSRQTPVEVTLMIMREIDLKCLLSSDTGVQLKGLRWLTYQLSHYALVNYQLISELLHGLSQIDAALCRFVDFLSHENREVRLFSLTQSSSLSLSCPVLGWPTVGTRSV